MSAPSTMRVRGHWLYCKKCVTPELTDEENRVLVALPERTQDTSQWVQVLAVGPDCGKRRDLPEWKKKLPDMRVWCSDPIRVGDLLLCPNHHAWGIVESPYDADEYFIDECVPLCAWREPEPEPAPAAAPPQPQETAHAADR